MRIISQSRVYDLPYDSTILIIREEKFDSGTVIEAYSTTYFKKICDMAKYTDSKLAKQEVIALHDAERTGWKIFYFPEDVKKKS